MTVVISQQQLQVEGREVEARGRDGPRVVYQEIRPNLGENFVLKLVILNTQELAVLY